jgi:cytochrome P450
VSGWTDPDRIPPPPEPPRWSVEQQAWVMSRHADVLAVLRNPAMVASDPGWELARIEARTGRRHPHLAAALAGTMLFQQGPRHRATRAAMRTVLAELSRRWNAAALDAAAAAIAGALPDDAALDVAAALADELPCRVAGEMLDLAPDVLRRLRALSQATTSLWRLMPPMREYARLEALCREAHEVLAETPARLLGLEDPGLDYPLADLVLFLVIAAVDSTASSITAGLDLLARDDALQARLRAEPGLTGGFVAEVLRLAGPLRRFNRRIAETPAVVGAVELPAQSGVILEIDRAHRDPVAYPRPDAVVLDRAGPALLAFGGGAHACQGAVLGQAQVAAMIAAVVARFDISPAPGGRAMADDPILHRFEALTLRLAGIARGAAAGA